MRTRTTVLVLASLVLFGGCGGGDSREPLIYSPVDFVLSNIAIQLESKETRFGYVADQFSRGVIVFDERRNRIVDTDPHPDFNDNLLPVGGEPSAIEIQDRTEAPRIFVADAFNRTLMAFDAVVPDDPTTDVLEHTPVDLGDTDVGRASRPLFRDRDRNSTPALLAIAVDETKGQNENWILEYEGDSTGYRVTGSLSGEQTTRAKEGKAYTSNNGAISFTVVPGGERTSKGDKFEFATVVTKPLSLTGRPVDLESDDTNLYVLTVTPPQLLVVNLSTFAIDQTVALVDPAGGDVVPTAVVQTGEMLYISNSGADNFFAVDPSDGAVTVIEPGIKARSLGYDPETEALYFIAVERRLIFPWDVASTTLLDSFRLSDHGLGFTPYKDEGVSYGLVPTAVGGTDVINTETNSRVDANVRDRETQSEAVGKEFYDVLPKSKPELISVVTNDGVTAAEQWQLIYEGVIPGSKGMAAEIDGNQLTVADASFQTTLGILVGDLVLIGGAGDQEEIAVSAVVSETELTLGSSPTHQGSQTIEVRPSGSYVVIGTYSGAQKNRVEEGVSYASDNEEIALTIRPSYTEPTTRGDYFSFATTEGIDPIPGGSRRIGRKAIVYSPIGGGDLRAYVIFEASGIVSRVNLRTFREDKTIP